MTQTFLTFLSFGLLVAFVWVIVLATGPFFGRLFHATLQRSAKLLARFGVDRLRDTRPHMWRWLPVLFPLIIGGIIAVAAGDTFLDLAELLQGKSSELDRIDRQIHAQANHLRSDWLTGFFTFFTIIGTPVGLGIMALLVALFLVQQKRYRWILYLGVTTIGGGLLNLQLKSFFARERPSLAEALRHASGYSFPSGHAMGSFIVFGALSYLAWRGIRTWKWRSLVLSILVASIVAVAASRIYLGVHWISDIAAGLAAGTVWLTATTTAYETLRRVRRVRGAPPSAIG